MRITGHSGNSGGGQSASGGRDRSDPEAFRRGRRVGQIVRGRLLAPGPGGLYWVVVAGHKLLASLDHEPAPGRELVFRIERLEPELTLKDITPPPSAQSDPALLLAALTDARSRFEHHLGRFVPPSAPPLDLTEARARFRAWLDTDAPAGEAQAKVLELCRLAAKWIAPTEGRFLYAPWIFPGLTQSEILATRVPPAAGGPGQTLRLFGRLEGAGRVAALVSWHPGRVVYRLMLERPEASDAVMAFLSRVRFGRAELVPSCLAVGALPAQFAAGFVSRLLAGAAKPFTGLRLRV
jgi:hypothetical protein